MDRCKGSALVCVIVVVSFVFLVSSAYIGKIQKNQQITMAKSDEYLHYLSVSGLEKACALINKQAEDVEKEIINRFNQTLIYKYTDDKYNGTFYLGESAEESLSDELETKIKSFFNNNYGTAVNTYGILYNVFDEDGAKYEVNIVITYGQNNLDGKKQNSFKLTSYAKNLKTNIVYDSSCVLAMNSFPVTENYYSKNNPEILNSGLYCTGEIINEEYTIDGTASIISETGKSPDNIFNMAIGLENREPDKLNNIFINQNINLDIAYYSGIIINKSSAINIYSSGDNVFNGIIISLGDAYINGDIVFNGALVCVGDIYLDGNITINQKSDIIYDVFIDDLVLKRKVFDFLRLTKYYQLSSNKVTYEKGVIESDAGIKVKTATAASKGIFYIREFVTKKI